MKLPSAELLDRCRKGIIFSGPMVSPILGRWKTVTRRLDRSWLKLAVGDLLYVRESIVRDPKLDHGGFERARFAADRCMVQRLDAWPWQRNNLPAIHMPRGLSRAVLRVTEAPRRERLQAITPNEVLLEGVSRHTPCCERDSREHAAEPCDLLVERFENLWSSLHTKPGERWDDNPELVRIPFELVEE